MIINTQTIKKSGGGRGTYQVEAGFLSGYNELIRPSLHTPAGTVFVPSDNPADYTKVDWIGCQENGTGGVSQGPYIKTGIVLDSTDKVEAEVSVNNTQNNMSIWSARSFSNNLPVNQFGVFSLTTGLRFDYGTTTYSSSVLSANAKHKCLSDKNKAYLDDVLVNEFTSSIFSTVNQVFLFASYWTDDSVGNFLSGRSYGWKCWNSLGNPKASFFPVYHTDTGILGMFDAVNNKFHMNAGAGDFTKPSDTSGEINLAEYLASLT